MVPGDILFVLFSVIYPQWSFCLKWAKPWDQWFCKCSSDIPNLALVWNRTRQLKVIILYKVCRTSDKSRLSLMQALRKHAYSNILKILPPKNENFQIKIFDIFHISAQNIDCWYGWRGGSNEYPQSVFWAEIRKIMYTPVNPSFTI